MNKRQHCDTLNHCSKCFQGFANLLKAALLLLCFLPLWKTITWTRTFLTPNSYQTPGQRQEDIATDYNSDFDLDLHETTLVSSVSKLEDYQKTVDDAIKKIQHIDAGTTQSRNDNALDRSSGCERR